MQVPLPYPLHLPFIIKINNKNKMNLFTRRDFIKRIGMLYGSILFYPSCSKNSSQYKVFTDDEAKCLITLCEQIIPADQDPGATDAEVIRFIEKQTSLRFPDELPLYQKGIAALQATCRGVHGVKFEKLSQGMQIETIQNMEQGRLLEVFWEDVSQQSFLNLVINRTMQGFYGSPRHGGNKDYVSYRMLKLEYPLLIGQNRYRHG